MDINNLAKIKILLGQNSLDAVLISSLSNIVYVANFQHFTDIEREGFVLITKNNDYVFTDARYSHAVRTRLKKFKLLEISANNPFTKLLEKIIKEEKIKTLGIEENNLTVAEHKKILSIITSIKHFNLMKIRIVKTHDEIQKIKRACAIGDKAFLYILNQIKPGMTEKDIAFHLENFIRESGCEPSFSTIVAFEENAAIPHHKSSDQKLKIDDLILIDFGVKYKNYCSDMTRTIFLGKASSEKKKAYQTVLIAQNKTIEYINNKLLAISNKQKNNEAELSASSVDLASREFIIKAGYSSIPHSLGHGIGLQVHESPSLSPKSKDILTEGMVFSIEPGIYLNDKFGVRIEDLFTIKAGKLITLTNASKDFIELQYSPS